MIRDLLLDDAKVLVVKRIIQAMGALVMGTSDHDCTMRLQGLGLALAICFEEFTGISAKQKKPSELMTWGLELPEPLIRKVEGGAGVQ